MVRGRRYVTTLIVVIAGMLAVAGCSPASSALSKLQNGQIGALTAAEWQALAGVGTTFGAPIPHLTDAQAEAIVNFLRVNHINTLEDLEAVINSGEVEVPPELEDVFADFV